MEAGSTTTEREVGTAEEELRDDHDPEAGPRQGLDAVRRMAEDPPTPNADDRLSRDDEIEVLSAGEWLLQAFDESATIPTRHIRLDVGGSLTGKRREIPWVLRAVEGDTLRSIRARAAETITSGPQKRSGNSMKRDSDAAARSNAEIVLAGTLKPDLQELAARRNLADAAILVEEAFKYRPGLIDLLSVAIMELSRYDDDAIRDDTEVSAAGNSPG